MIFYRAKYSSYLNNNLLLLLAACCQRNTTLLYIKIQGNIFLNPYIAFFCAKLWYQSTLCTFHPSAQRITDEVGVSYLEWVIIKKLGVHKSAQLAYWFSLEYANGQHLHSPNPEFKEEMEKEFCPLPFYQKFTSSLSGKCVPLCVQRPDEQIELDTILEQFHHTELSVGRKHIHLTPASMENAHKTPVLALCCLFFGD